MRLIPLLLALLLAPAAFAADGDKYLFNNGNWCVSGQTFQWCARLLCEAKYSGTCTDLDVTKSVADGGFGGMCDRIAVKIESEDTPGCGEVTPFIRDKAAGVSIPLRTSPLTTTGTQGELYAGSESPIINATIGTTSACTTDLKVVVKCEQHR